MIVFKGILTHVHVKCQFYIKTWIVSVYSRLGRLNRAYPEELPVQGILCLLVEYDISDPTQMDLTSNFYLLCTNMNVYLYNYS